MKYFVDKKTRSFATSVTIRYGHHLKFVFVSCLRPDTIKNLIVVCIANFNVNVKLVVRGRSEKCLKCSICLVTNLCWH